MPPAISAFLARHGLDRKTPARQLAGAALARLPRRRAGRRVPRPPGDPRRANSPRRRTEARRAALERLPGRGHLPGLRRRPAPARGAGRHGRRLDDPGGLRPARLRGARRFFDALTFEPPAGPGRPAAGPRDRRPAGVPRPGRPGLPEPRPAGRHALRRRAAAGPPGDADRLGAGRGLLRPRRADRRPPPARHRAAAREPGRAPRPGQQRPRRRARRGDDPRRRLGHRPRPRRRPRRRPDRRRRAPRRPGRGRARRLGDRSDTCAARPRSAAPHADRLASSPGWITVVGASRAQPQGGRRAIPARRADLRLGRERVGQEHAGPRRPGAGGAPGSRGSGRGRGPSGGSTGLDAIDKLIEIDQAPIGRGPALDAGDVYRRLRRDPQGLRPDARGEGPRLQGRTGSASTSRAGAARPARGRGSARSR